MLALPRPAYLDLNGTRYLWRDLIELRRNQLAAARRLEQPSLFELVEDREPACEGIAALRCRKPSLLSLINAPKPVNPGPDWGNE